MSNMGKSDVHDVFKYIQILLTATGIWPKPDATLLYKIKGFVSYFLSAVFNALAFVQIYYTFNGIETVNHAFFLNLAIIFYLPKIAIFFYNRQDFFKILNQLNQPVFKSYNSDFDFYLANRVGIFTKLQLGFQILCMSTLFLVGFIPFFGDNFKTDLPVPFPFDLSHQSNWIYGLFWVIQICILNLSALNNTAVDILACSFMGIAAAHLEILRETLNNLIDRQRINGNETTGLPVYVKHSEEILRKIKDCVQHHIAIEELIKSIELTFTYMFLVQFMSSTAIICTTGFTFIIVPLASVKFGVSFLFFACVTVQLAIYCAFGDDVMIQSSRIREACYMSEWNNCDTQIRKCLFIIMERSKRPFILTAGKFAPLTLTSLVLIMKSSFSYFAALQKLYNKSKTNV